MVGLKRQSPFDLAHRHSGLCADNLVQSALVVGIEVDDHDHCGAGIVGHRAEKVLQRFDTAGGCSDPGYRYRGTGSALLPFLLVRLHYPR